MQRFRSKIDIWILVLLIGILSIQAYVLVATVMQPIPTSAKYAVAGSSIFAFVLVASLLLRTHYTIDGNELKIVSGPIRRIVKISEISRISESNALWSSPALSLDRLKIEYANTKRVLISPDDKAGFLKAIGRTSDTPHI